MVSPLPPLPLGIQTKCVVSGCSLDLNVSFPSECMVPKHPWLSNPSQCWSIVFYFILLLAGVIHFIIMMSADKARSQQGNFKKIRNSLQTLPCWISPLLVESLATLQSIRKVQTLIAFPAPCEKTLAETCRERMEAFVFTVHLMYLLSHSCETEMYPSPTTRGLALKTGLKVLNWEYCLT